MQTVRTSTSTAAPNIDTLARVLAFMRANVAKTADEVRPVEVGWVVRSRSLPAVWAVNHLRVALALPFDTLVEFADEQLAGSRYVHITLENQEAGRRSRTPSAPPAGRSIASC